MNQSHQLFLDVSRIIFAPGDVIVLSGQDGVCWSTAISACEEGKHWRHFTYPHFCCWMVSLKKEKHPKMLGKMDAL